MAKRRICSNDVAEVPADAFLLDDGEGQMYFCNPRCLCLWALALGTRSELPEKQKAAVYTLTSPEGSRRSFKESWSSRSGLRLGRSDHKQRNGCVMAKRFRETRTVKHAKRSKRCVDDTCGGVPSRRTC